MVQMKMSEDSQAYSCIPLRPLITNNQPKALASSRKYHEATVTNIPVNILSRQLERNRKVCQNKKRSQSTDMWRLPYVASVKPKVVPVRTTELNRAAEVRLQFFWTSALVESEWPRPVHISNGKRIPYIHRTGGWVGPRYGLAALEKIKSIQWSQQKERYKPKDVEARGSAPTVGNNMIFVRWGWEEPKIN